MRPFLAWSPGTVRDILFNDRYLGVIRWNQTRQGVYRGGTKTREDRPEDEHIELKVPELQIVSEELWRKVHAAPSKKSFGRRSASGRKPKYFLSAVSRCGICGGPIKVNNHRLGRKKVRAYGCGYHRDRGPAVCANSLKRVRCWRRCWWGRWCGRPSRPKKDAGTRFEESSIRLAFYLEEVTPLSMASPTGHALL